MTSIPTGARTTVLLFGHHDDEFGVLPLISAAQKAGENILAVYCTSSLDATQEVIRQSESRIVMRAMGVKDTCLVFLGVQLGIMDGESYRHLPTLLSSVTALLDSRSFSRIHFLVPAWEGGHHDHDAAHAVGLAASKNVRLGTKLSIHQFPLYTAALGGFAFRVMHPRKENGPVQRFYFGFAEGLRMLGLLRHYRSQWRSFAGLLPGAIWRYLVLRHVCLQDTALLRIATRPHTGALFYERRYGVPYAAIAAAIYALSEFIRKEP